MAVLNLGRVRLNFKGEYNNLNGLTLEFFDAVTYAGSLYVVTAESLVVDTSITGNRPPSSIGQLSFLKIAEGTEFIGPWTASTVYYKNQIVSFASSSYIALREVPDTRNNPLVEVENDTDYWGEVAKGFGTFQENYTGAEALSVYEIVIWQGSLYVTTAEVSANQTPSTNPELFKVLAPGIGISGDWTAGFYAFRDSVNFHGKRYIVVNLDGTSNQPLDATTGLLDADWQILTQGFQFVGDYDDQSTDGYYPGDAFVYNNTVYIVLERLAIGEDPVDSPSKVHILTQSATFTLAGLDDIDATAAANGSIFQYQDGIWYASDHDNDILLIPTGDGTVTVAADYLSRPNFANNSLVPKSYVDSVINGLNVKKPVRVATTSALTDTFYDNTGNFFIGINPGIITIDGISLSQGDRILIKDQTIQYQNGIYVVSNPGDSDDYYRLDRAGDADAANEIEGGSFVFVQEGVTNSENGYVATHDGLPTIGSSSITWEQFSGAGQVQNGDGLIKVGNQLSVNVDNQSLVIDNNTLQVNNSGITNDMLAGNIDLETKVTNILPVTNGGTGLASITENSLLYGNANNGFSQTVQSSAGQALYSNNGVPSWTNIINGGEFGTQIDPTYGTIGIRAKIKIRKSETALDVPTIADIAVGEMAVNTADRKIYVRDSNDSIVEIANFDAATSVGDDSFINALIFG